MYKIINELERTSTPVSRTEIDEDPLKRIYYSFLSTQRDAFEDLVSGKYDSEEQFMFELLELCLFAGLMYREWKQNPDEFQF